ncbi:MAG TPA: L,D-transpeptidase [Candidatus Dormibacteraeota bacterium]|nr:L,D-transpeptidase [Candidatus Dormibacteraeota bacterium]
MRLRYLIPVLLIVCVAAGGAATAHAAGDRQKSFSEAAGQLRARWDHDQAAGVPASSLAPLRAELASQQPTDSWWSPNWLSNAGHGLLDRLQAETRSAWSAALDAQRAQAETVITQWSDFAAQQTTWLSGDAIAAAAQWSSQLSAAATPAAITALVSAWQGFLGQQHTAVVAAQQARLSAELQSAGGPQAVLSTARHLVAVASSANLDAGNVAPLAAQLSSQITANSAAALDTGEQLLGAVSALQSLVNLNNQVAGQVRPVYLSVLQAEAEGTPNAAALAAQQAAIGGQFRSARTAAQITAVATALTALQGQIATELAANQCGHPVGAGKVITISLSLQEMVFYQGGCVARATAVTTGRPQLRTPTGRFSIFYKTSPFTFISPWPPSSPFYYYPSPVSWVMEFAAGGYFIHDAPWEGGGSYGPGGEDNLSAASHGCVHTPTPVMQWAFSWTPLGTPVVISA